MPAGTKVTIRFLHIPTKTFVEEVGYAEGAIDEAGGFKKFTGKLAGESTSGAVTMRASDLGAVLAFMSQKHETVASIP